VKFAHNTSTNILKKLTHEIEGDGGLRNQALISSGCWNYIRHKTVR